MLLGDPGVAEWSEILDDIEVYHRKAYAVRASRRALLGPNRTLTGGAPNSRLWWAPAMFLSDAPQEQEAGQSDLLRYSVRCSWRMDAAFCRVVGGAQLHASNALDADMSYWETQMSSKPCDWDSFRTGKQLCSLHGFPPALHRSHLFAWSLLPGPRMCSSAASQFALNPEGHSPM